MKDTVLTGRVSRPRREKRDSLGCVCIVGGGGPRWLEGECKGATCMTKTATTAKSGRQSRARPHKKTPNIFYN